MLQSSQSVEAEESRASKRAFVYSGPLPPSAELASYEKIKPGLADRIIHMAENEQSHRHKLEAQELAMTEKQIKAAVRESFLGQFFAFSIALFTVSAGAYVTIQGAEIPGSILGTAGLAAIVYVFIQGRK